MPMLQTNKSEITSCAMCGARGYTQPLHGAEGGVMCCMLCIGKWHAEHGRRRRLGRIVIRAIAAFLDGGGQLKDIDDLKHTAMCKDSYFGLDPLGYLVGVAATKDEVIELTSDVLTDTLKLVHPDHHPPERRELAQRVTQQLLALQPFVFPAPKPKPVPEPELRPTTPGGFRDNREGKWSNKTDGKSRFPCAGCADTTPYYYCTPCKTEYDKREREKAECARAKQRAWYARRPKMRTPPKPAKDTPRSRTTRQARVVNQIQSENLINHWLSGLQIAILRTAYSKRVPGSRGCDISQAELLAEIWGWKPSCDLRWTEEEAARRNNNIAPYWDNKKDPYCRAGDTRAWGDTHGAFNHIPPYQRRRARASLSRALSRLEKRLLISFVYGTMGTYSGGLVLTPHGERIARASIETSAQGAALSSPA
jgi:hypothetical protein